MNNTEQVKKEPIVVKIMIPVDGKMKAIKTIKVFDNSGTAREIATMAEHELDIFKCDNPILSNLVKGEVSFKLSFS